jgi:hypothetical protein
MADLPHLILRYEKSFPTGPIILNAWTSWIGILATWMCSLDHVLRTGFCGVSWGSLIILEQIPWKLYGRVES